MTVSRINSRRLRAASYQARQKQDLRDAQGSQDAAGGLGECGFERGGRPEAKCGAGERDIEESLIALAAIFDAQQVNVVGHGHRGERTLDIQGIDGRGELVIGRTDIGTLSEILVTCGVQQLGLPPAAGEHDVREKRL